VGRGDAQLCPWMREKGDSFAQHLPFQGAYNTDPFLQLLYILSDLFVACSLTFFIYLLLIMHNQTLITNPSILIGCFRFSRLFLLCI
jgi:hypothetical protein